jgi:hypothetical protein
MPGPSDFFFQEAIFPTIILTIILLWIFAFVKEIAKHGHARALGLESKFGLANHYHWFIPRAFVSKTTEQQEHKIISSSLLSVLALTLLSGILATYTGSGFWSFFFLIGFIELLSECLLFLGTDLAKYISFKSMIHDLNEQTKELLIADWKGIWSGNRKQAHAKVNAYAFLYLCSIVLGVVLFATYILPISLGVIQTAVERMDSSHPLFFDGLETLTFLMIDLVFYAFATIRRHPLAHNTLFINISLTALVVASFFAATVAVSWTDHVHDLFTAGMLLYATGMVFAILFARALSLAHPFSDLHTVYETVVLPIVAACVPLSVLFTIPGEPRYFHAAILALGMLTTLAFIEMRRVAIQARAAESSVTVWK